MSTPFGPRTAVVAGASRGIGLATARALAGAGARVAMLARGAEALVARARELGNAAIPLPCDVTDPAAVALAVARLESALGAPPDLLVNSAGLFPMASIVETSAESFAQTVAANLVAPFLVIRALLPGMTERGRGHIVTVGSVADRTIFPGNAAYAASKFGARALHEVLRAELRGTGVRATLVSPAATDTPIWDALDPDARADLPDRADMLRPEDVADAILYAVTRAPAVNIDELRLSRS
ncbi:MAG: SDR family NAD(P)-dependent oxidoreductase [Gemmatimonadaceae bacterium]